MRYLLLAIQNDLFLTMDKALHFHYDSSYCKIHTDHISRDVLKDLDLSAQNHSNACLRKYLKSHSVSCGIASKFKSSGKNTEFLCFF
jgi:hypothetical protein